MRWLVVEDALRDRKGHWFEWVTTFYDGLRELGDEVVVLADSSVEPAIRERLRALPVLPASIWHRMGDGASPIIRYARVFAHAWKTWLVLRRHLATAPEYDLIFVPTVLVHHLLAWTWIVKGVLHGKRTRIMLFFLTAPTRRDSTTGKVVLDNSPTAKLMLRLLQRLRPDVESGRVVLGVETRAMQQTMSSLTHVPFTYLPQPVCPIAGGEKKGGTAHSEIEMACYGAARAEKGSDILQKAILAFRRNFPESRARFVIQWIEDFADEQGRTVRKLPELLGDARVEFLTRYFVDREYPARLRRTDVLLLPYRASSYDLRGSRVVIEAVVNGIPVIATNGTTLAELAAEFGASVICQDGDVETLVAAMREMEVNFQAFRERAASRQTEAALHFCVRTFRDILLRPAGDQAYPLKSAAGKERDGIPDAQTSPWAHVN